MSSLASADADAALNDARLNDLCFLDARLGWAVGDRGTIWHTDDGGRQWRRQNSGTTAPLHAVEFIDERIGWAAGGSTTPYLHGSAGVVLATRDGGQTWTPLANPALPALRRIGFFNAQRGWAAGCSSPFFPSGAMMTDDGGRSWQPVPGATAAGWTAADFLESQAGVLAGRDGAIASVRRGQIEIVAPAEFQLPSHAALRLMPTGRSWLAGEGGRIQTTADLGRTWHDPPGGLPPAARHFDFAALAAGGSKCWIAGSPGTKIFHSPDGGQTWTASDTGSFVPLRAITFADDLHGWAAGELGTILATQDGGRSWQIQRAGGSQAALLALFADPEDVPLEWIAYQSACRGYLSVAEIVGRRDVDGAPRGRMPIADRFHETVVRAGGSAGNAAWQFPLPPIGLNLPPQLVRRIRLWRPEVIVTHDAVRSSGDSPAAVVHQAVLEAVRLAAEPAAMPELAAEAGLPPWQVKRIVTVMPSSDRDADESPADRFEPRLGRTPVEAADEPRGLLHERFSPTPRPAAFRIVADLSAVEPAGRDWFGGLAIVPGGPARRNPLEIRTENLDLDPRIARKRRHIQAILERANRLAVSTDQLLAQINHLTGDLDDDRAARILFQLADQTYREGRWPQAAELFAAVAERYPGHPLAPQAWLWLLRYHAAAEAVQRAASSASALRAGENRFGPPAMPAPPLPIAAEIKQLERALTLAKEIERTRPELFAEPEVRFPLAAAYRGLGQVQQAERLYQLQQHAGGPWTDCAQAELRPRDPTLRQSKPTLLCVKAPERPRLDGRLDDPVWQQANPVALQWCTAVPGRDESPPASDDAWTSGVMLAYDAEFLYLAAHCRRPSGEAASTPEAAPGPSRPRDADLSARDRVEIFLDIDRDYAVYYRLAVDDRGWTNDACWRDVAWNPQWFVAVDRTGDAWTVEAAVPLSELAARPPRSDETWAVGLQRVLPGVGLQSWSRPAAFEERPEGFGFLTFEP